MKRLLLVLILGLLLPFGAEAQQDTAQIATNQYGETTLSVTVGNIVFTVPVVVTVPSSAIDTLLVVPSEANLEPGDQMCFVALAVTEQGDTVPGRWVQGGISWSSSNPDVAEVLTGEGICQSSDGGSSPGGF